MTKRRLPVLALLVASVAFAPVAIAADHHGHGSHGGGHHAYRGGWHGGHGGGRTGAAIVGGLLGLGLGAAIAGSSQPYYPPNPPVYYPAPGYYPPPVWGYTVPPPTYAPSAGGSAKELNSQELYRLQMTPY